MILIIDISQPDLDVQPLKHREMSDRKKIVAKFHRHQANTREVALQPTKIV